MIQGSIFSIAFRLGFQGCKRINNNDNNVQDALNVYCSLYSRIIIKIETVRDLRVRKLKKVEADAVSYRLAFIIVFSL